MKLYKGKKKIWEVQKFKKMSATNGTNTTTTPLPSVVCDPTKELELSERRWYVFIGIYAALWVGGLIFISIGRCLQGWMYNIKRRKEAARRKNQPPGSFEVGSSWYAMLSNISGDLESGHSTPGKVLVSYWCTTSVVLIQGFWKKIFIEFLVRFLLIIQLKR